MNQKRINPHWKRAFLVLLCAVQCLALVFPVATAFAQDADYLIGSMPAQEGAEIDAVSTMLKISEDPAWGGIKSKATIRAAEGITLIGEQKAMVIDSTIVEGYAHSAPTYPLFSMDCAWKKLNTAEQDIMFYVELPETSSSFRLWAITCNGWSFWVEPKGMEYQYLPADAEKWENGKISSDDSKNLVLTPGFKGYVRLRVNTAANADKFPDKELTIQSFEFRADLFGGNKGALKFGGVWFVSKENYVKIKVDNGEVVNMTKLPDEEPEPSEPTEPSVPGGNDQWTGDVLTGHYQNHETGAVGGKATQVSVDRDQNYWGNPTKANVTLTKGITPIGDTFAYVIDSPIGEGFNNLSGKTAPFFNLFGSWLKMNITTQDFMFYIELPAVSQGLRLHGFTATASVYCWPEVTGMKYQYLAMGSSKWENGTVSTDGNKTLALPQGFKGYVRIKLDTASNVNKLPSMDLSIERMQFYIDRFGGSNGAVKIGGVWAVSRENTHYIQVDGGPVLCMTDAETVEPGGPTDPPEPEPPEPSEPTEPSEPEVDPDDPDRDYIVGSMPVEEGAEPGTTSSMTIISEDPAWGGIKSQANIKAAAGITIIGDQNATVIDSPIAEGYSSPAGPTYPLFEVSCAWQELDTSKQDVMFYIELPNTGSGIRLHALTCNGWTFWIAPNGMEYQYLSMDSNKWESGQISNDDNKTLTLPQGFKGYVRLKVTTARNAAQFPAAKMKIQSFSFRADLFGGDYGALKLGGVWFVSREDFCHIRVDGAQKKVMTNYWTNNDAAIGQFEELMDKLNQKDLSAAPIIDQLEILYDSMSEEYKAKVTKEDLAKIQEYAASVDSYRPTFLGASLKAVGSATQGMKFGWTVDEALAQECGYRVVDCGAVMLFARKYDGSIIDENTPDAAVLKGKLTDGACIATANIAKADYLADVLVRCYVVYENVETGERFSIWCGSYTDRAGQTNPYLQCSLFEVANYFGVPLYGK